MTSSSRGPRNASASGGFRGSAVAYGASLAAWLDVPVRGGAKWVGWEAEAMLRWLRERDGYAEVRCISKEARTAFWAQE